MKKISSVYSLSFFCRVRISRIIGDNRNLFLKIKTKFWLFHVVLTTPNPSPEKVKLTVVKMQQLPDIENIHFRKIYFLTKMLII